MTIETQASKVLYVGDGAAVTFPVPFPVHQAGHLRLYLSEALEREIVMETGYSVSGAGSGEVCVTLSAPLPSGKHLAIARLVPLTQQMDLENGGSFDAETIERQFDITEMQIQQLQEQIDRGIKVPLTDGRDPDAFWLELLDASRAALEAYRNTLALADAQALDSYAVNVRRSYLVPEDVPAGGELILPASYYPGRNILYLAVDGVVCTPRRPDDADHGLRQYEEIGEDTNALSDRVRVHFPVLAGQLVDVWVVSSNHQNTMDQLEGLVKEAELGAESAAASAGAAAQSVQEAAGEADRAAEEARAAGESAQSAATSAAEAARFALEAGQGTANLPNASPTQRGLETAGGTANQVRIVNADGTAYGWGNVPVEALPLATSEKAGAMPRLGQPGQVPKVSADGQRAEWVDAPTVSAASAATATEDGTAGTAIYAADNDTTSREKAATPAGVAAQIAMSPSDAPKPINGVGVGQWVALPSNGNTSTVIVLPSGGTWAYAVRSNPNHYNTLWAGVAAGGTTVHNYVTPGSCLAWRIA